VSIDLAARIDYQPWDASFEAERAGEGRAGKVGGCRKETLLARGHHFIVTRDQEGERLDRFLASTGVVSRTRARKALAAGGVYLNRKRVKIASRPVHEGDEVVCYLSVREEEHPSPTLNLLYQDEHIVVANKPPGMAVQATRESDRGTLQQILHAVLGRNGPAPRVVHRLDRPASGAVVLALTRKAAAALSAQMAEHSPRRRYLVVVEGPVQEEETVLVHYLGRMARGGATGGPVRVRVRPARGPLKSGERRAVTRVRRLDIRGNISLVVAVLETGRTHQLRAQLAFEGHPVVGDRRYGAREVLPGVDGIPLHAGVLEFSHPVTGAPLGVVAPLPEALEAWLTSAGFGRWVGGEWATVGVWGEDEDGDTEDQEATCVSDR